MRVYSVIFDNVSIAAAQDLFSLVAAAQKPISLLALHLSNVGVGADAGDAEEELWRWSVVTGHTTVGSGGTAPTPQIVPPSQAAAAFTARVNDTTIASAGTAITKHVDGWNVRIPLQQIWVPECRPGSSILTASSRIVVRLLSTPTDAVLCSGTLYVGEHG